MTLEEADKIVQIWAKYMEYAHGKLRMLFLPARIPESFLPFPSKTIEEASNVVAEHYHNMGDQETVEVLQTGIAYLISYTDDEEAVLQAAKIFNDPDRRKAKLRSFKKFQKDWVESHPDFLTYNTKPVPTLPIKKTSMEQGKDWKKPLFILLYSAVMIGVGLFLFWFILSIFKLALCN